MIRSGEEFRPPRLLRTAHVQSVLGSSPLRRSRIERDALEFLVASREVVLDCGEGVRLLAHHAPPANPAAGKMAVLIHGWEGSSSSAYMLSGGSRLWRRGFRVFRLNLRDHGGSHHLNRELFHSCRLAEVTGAVAQLQRQYPEEALHLAGYSLGGNFALRVGAAAPAAGLRLERVAALCPVLDPADTLAALDSGWFGYRIYFLRKWRESLWRKRAVFPELYDLPALEQFRSLRDMTAFFVARYTDFPDLGAYLRGYALTGSALHTLSARTTVLLAEDDPVIPVSGLARVRLPRNAKLHQTKFGGHCAFIESYRLRSWMDDYLLRALTATPDNRSPGG